VRATAVVELDVHDQLLYSDGEEQRIVERPPQPSQPDVRVLAGHEAGPAVAPPAVDPHAYLWVLEDVAHVVGVVAVLGDDPESSRCGSPITGWSWPATAGT
jgi:hypothetical protein